MLSFHVLYVYISKVKTKVFIKMWRANKTRWNFVDSIVEVKQRQMFQNQGCVDLPWDVK